MPEKMYRISSGDDAAVTASLGKIVEGVLSTIALTLSALITTRQKEKADPEHVPRLMTPIPDIVCLSLIIADSVRLNDIECWLAVIWSIGDQCVHSANVRKYSAS